MTNETSKAPQPQTVPKNLQASEISYRRLFESARDGILTIEAASRKITEPGN